MTEIFKTIEKHINENNILLFMKGTKEFPQCGFSGFVVQILNRLEVSYETIDVLKNDDIRQGIKDYTDWPTIPQLYIKGEFVGGADIIKEMYENNELQDLFA